MGAIRYLIEWTSAGIEVLAVAVIVAAIVPLALTRGTVRYLLRYSTAGTDSAEYKPCLSKPLLMALELLFAADVLRTVALEPTLNPTLNNAAALAPPHSGLYLLQLVDESGNGRTLALATEGLGARPEATNHTGSNSLQPLAEQMHQFSGDAKDSRRARRSSGGAGVLLLASLGEFVCNGPDSWRKDT